VPPEGTGFADYLEGKYGPGVLAGMAARLGDAAAADGLPLIDVGALERRPSTFLAHRLLAGALEEGEDVQQELQQRLGLGLLSAYWARGADVGDRAVLEDVAEAAGMPAERAAVALDGDLTATAVRLDERRAAELGIRAVPTFVFGGRFAVSGAQSPVALADAARRALAGA
jgi:predicted DsbA family dithiol-disulfide isomerase